jgi:hypothetical protein
MLGKSKKSFEKSPPDKPWRAEKREWGKRKLESEFLIFKQLPN